MQERPKCALPAATWAGVPNCGGGFHASAVEAGGAGSFTVPPSLSTTRRGMLGTLRVTPPATPATSGKAPPLLVWKATYWTPFTRQVDGALTIPDCMSRDRKSVEEESVCEYV